VRLDHLLSKEKRSIVGRHSSCPVRTTPSWCTGGSVESVSAVVGFVLPWSSLERLCLLFRFEGAGPRAGFAPSAPGTSVEAFEAFAPLPAASVSGCAPPFENCRASTSISHGGSTPVFPRNTRWPFAQGDRLCGLGGARGRSPCVLFFQATKSQRWMPWRQEPMKDVSDCEKLR
jgi:hypothetical protein